MDSDRAAFRSKMRSLLLLVNEARSYCGFEGVELSLMVWGFLGGETDNLQVCL